MTTTTPTVITSDSFTSVIDALKSQLSVTTVVEVLAYVAGICVALVFMWWGVRKASKALMSAFKKGKLRL